MGVCSSTTEEVDGRTTLPPSVPEERPKFIISSEREEGLEMAVATMEARFFKEEKEADKWRKQCEKEEQGVRLATEVHQKAAADVELAMVASSQISERLSKSEDKEAVQLLLAQAEQHLENQQQEAAAAAATVEKEKTKAEAAWKRKRKEDQAVFEAAAKLARAEKAHSEYSAHKKLMEIELLSSVQPVQSISSYANCKV